MQKKASFLRYREPISDEFGRAIKNCIILKKETIKNNFKNYYNAKLGILKKVIISTGALGMTKV